MPYSVGIVGARGYVGKELLDLIENHRDFSIGLQISARDGLSADDVANTKLDAYALALPNGATTDYVAAIEKAHPSAVIVDLSADNRFTDAWVYGQPERHREAIRRAHRISNPGCYATAVQLALAPLVPLLDGPANAFGVSGYSGAGTTPSPKNDPEVLRDNLYPYSLVGHVHEREVTRQLGHPVFFMPHVAPFFRGITVTVSVTLKAPSRRADLVERYRQAYANERLVTLSEDPPLVRDIAQRHHVAIGGLSVSADERHAVVVATIDNLLGGAATQALRNLNLALGLDECAGILDPA